MEYKEYYEAIEAFMREIDGLHVKSIGLVALVDEADIFDVVSCYDTGPHELAAMAGILQMHADDVGGVVIDTETSDVDPRFIDPILDIDCITPSSSGLSCVASAILALLLGNNLVCGKYITIVGRGHAVRGLAPLLTEQGATVTVAHSKTPMVNKATVGADVVVYAVPRTASFGFTLDTKDMVIDLSRVIPYPDLLPNAKYVDGIGKLTVSILLNRFVKNCHRKELS